MLAFLAPLAVLLGFFQEFWTLIKDPKYRSIVYWLILVLAAGTIFYSLVKGWSLLHSPYFCILSLATVGCGDFASVTVAGKIFASIYILSGLSLLATFLDLLAKESRVLRGPDQGESSE